MAYKYLELIGYEPCFFSEAHKRQSEACMESILEMRKHYIYPEKARQQVLRNEELLRTDPRYKMSR